MPKRPDHFPLLLQEGLAHYQRQDYAAAFKLLREVLEEAPALGDAWYLSGLAVQQLGDHPEAIRRIRQAITIAPGNPFYHLNLGNLLQSCNESDAAEAEFRRAIEINPGFSSAHHNLGNLLVATQREAMAAREYELALSCDPQHVGAMIALGRLSVVQRNHPKALELIRKALSLRPNDSDCIRLCLPVLLDAGCYDLVHEYSCRLLSGHPNNAEILTYHGRACHGMVQFSKAIAAFERAIQLDPKNSGATEYLADSLAQIGDPDSAARLLAEKTILDPANLALYSYYLFLQNYSATVSPSQLLAAHLKWDAKNNKPALPQRYANNPDHHRRLRIGYVSPDVREHPVTVFFEPLLDHHNHHEFEVFVFSTASCPDQTTTRLKSKIKNFFDIGDAVTPAHFSQQLANHQIDLLIDLAGHTWGNSLPALAMKPAPIQLSWLGYPNTTGLSAIDYRISDAVADPVGLGDSWNSETVLRLPNCFHCYRPSSTVPFDPTPPSGKTGSVTFVSFNVLGKLSDPTLAAWARILEAVPGSRLLLKSRSFADEMTRERILSRLRQNGVEGQRIQLVGYQPDHGNHLLQYRQGDIALDPFPYNGTTTTCDALWMGVPVVCLRGDRHAARVGASLLGAVKLESLTRLITTSIEDYVATAIALATDPSRLADLHRNLRPAMQASPLMDEPGFTRDLEAIYRRIWQQWCTQQNAAHGE